MERDTIRTRIPKVCLWKAGTTSRASRSRSWNK